MSPTNGWDVSWPLQHYATGSASWHQMSQFFMGMADTSGGYDTWLQLAPASRAPFLVVTPDKRFPQGTNRGAQNNDSQPASFASTRYFRNRAPSPDAAQGYRRTKCGNMWDALKWEYRMETAFTGYGMWFFAARGWGDLPEGTAVSWPAPYQELQVRQVPIYGLGGVGLPGGSGRGNYGLFAGGVY